MTLQQLRRQIDTLLDRGDDGIYGVDREGRATVVMPALAAMTGHTVDELVGTPIHDVLHHSHADGQHYPRQECPIFTACRTGSVQHAEETFWRKDGTSFRIEYTTMPMVERGEVVGGVVMLRDLDRRRELRSLIDSALQNGEAPADPPPRPAARAGAPSPAGSSRAWLSTMDTVRRVAAADTAVLLLGETGTGKELLAQAVHDLSPRAQRPLVKVNCAAIPAGLIESELFGHERGAFTGAASHRLGRFEQAADGTLFLDEVGELTLEAQAKLLRVLQEREFERVGGSRTIAARARIVAATNRDLALQVEEGTFRADLYYRLNVFPIPLPPLRARRGDIPLLVEHFLRKLEPRLGRRLFGFTSDSQRRLLAHDWPGNVRELENVVERAALMSDDGHLELPPEEEAAARAPAAGARAAPVPPRLLDAGTILTALQRFGWKVTGSRGAAAALGIHPNTLRNRMRQLGIARPLPQ